jgi:hypothetical protein
MAVSPLVQGSHRNIQHTSSLDFWGVPTIYDAHQQFTVYINLENNRVLGGNRGVTIANHPQFAVLSFHLISWVITFVLRMIFIAPKVGFSPLVTD